MVRVAAERYAKGETMAELAEVYGVSEPTIWRALQPETAAAAQTEVTAVADKRIRNI